MTALPYEWPAPSPPPGASWTTCAAVAKTGARRVDYRGCGCERAPPGPRAGHSPRFDTGELLQSTVLLWIEIIGEAARGVSDKVRDAHPEVPWRVITDMRNRVTHGYFDIDLDVVWNTVTRDLPKLQESVTRILSELDSEAEDSR